MAAGPERVTANLEACARRVYELHRSWPPWSALPEAERSRLIAAYWRVRSRYEIGRQLPRESRICNGVADIRAA